METQKHTVTMSISAKDATEARFRASMFETFNEFIELDNLMLLQQKCIQRGRAEINKKIRNGKKFI